jgi:asparagine synthase (glutamine-hydrolysing)
MCGIAGLFVVDGRPRDSDPAASALRMVDTLAHRGPDGRGAWGDADAGIGLGHRRLSIIDLSPTGAQPMTSADGRYVISYNGEVYNFPELRTELEARGHRFRGTSDTEVMLAACLEWGPEAAVRRFAGMFAFALFDRQARTLRLVRDRLGVKPLYWTISDGVLLFGSELRALMAHPAFRKEIDREAIAAVVRYSYVPTPATVFHRTHKLPAGSILTVQPQALPRIEPYWRLVDVLARKAEPCGEHEAVERLDALLRTSVRRRMIADVPLGAFLSGGTDSSAVVAAMQSVANRPARTFTIGFSDAAYDETAAARKTARHLGTDHTEVMLEPGAAVDLVARVADWFDEPFADASQLPTYLVAQTTRRYVAVALSGDGGDELFAGYPKYDLLARLWRGLAPVPRPLRRALGGMMAALPEGLLRAAVSIVLDAGRAERIGEKMRRLGAAVAAPSDADAVLALAVVGFGDVSLVNGASGKLCPGVPGELWALQPDLVARMQSYDTLTYLPDDILTKVDRCTMAVSLEAREPLLDHELVEFVWSLPAATRRGDGAPKSLLRGVLKRYVPPAFLDRPKRGFSVPLGAWLRGPLREWAEDLVSPAKLTSVGLFDVDRVRRLWDHHLCGREENATGLWNVLMIQAWAQRWAR